MGLRAPRAKVLHGPLRTPINSLRLVLSMGMQFELYSMHPHGFLLQETMLEERFLRTATETGRCS